MSLLFGWCLQTPPPPTTTTTTTTTTTKKQEEKREEENEQELHTTDRVIRGMNTNELTEEEEMINTSRHLFVYTRTLCQLFILFYEYGYVYETEEGAEEAYYMSIIRALLTLVCSKREPTMRFLTFILFHSLIVDAGDSLYGGIPHGMMVFMCHLASVESEQEFLSVYFSTLPLPLISSIEMSYHMEVLHENMSKVSTTEVIQAIMYEQTYFDTLNQLYQPKEYYKNRYRRKIIRNIHFELSLLPKVPRVKEIVQEAMENLYKNYLFFVFLYSVVTPSRWSKIKVNEKLYHKFVFEILFEKDFDHKDTITSTIFPKKLREMIMIKKKWVEELYLTLNRYSSSSSSPSSSSSSPSPSPSLYKLQSSYLRTRFTCFVNGLDWFRDDDFSRRILSKQFKLCEKFVILAKD